MDSRTDTPRKPPPTIRRPNPSHAKTEGKTKMKMTKSIQVWWNTKLVDVVSDEEARKILANGNAVQIAENMIKITPRW
jgi:hypothetical protein